MLSFTKSRNKLSHKTNIQSITLDLPVDAEAVDRGEVPALLPVQQHADRLRQLLHLDHLPLGGCSSLQQQQPGHSK